MVKIQNISIICRTESISARAGGILAGYKYLHIHYQKETHSGFRTE